MAQQINLYNPSFRRQKKPFSAVAMAQGLALITVGMIGFSIYAAYQLRSAAAVTSQGEKQLESVRTQFIALAKQRQAPTKGSPLVEELARTEAQAKTRRDLLANLRTGALGNIDGFSKYLAAFARQKTDGVWLTAIAVGGDENDLVVRGRVLRAELVPAYLKALNTEEVMRGRKVTDLSLSAVQEPAPAVGTGQPGAGAAGAASAHRPNRFVEFSMSAPRRPEDAQKPAESPEPQRRAPS
jgi:hypothetical protein